MTEKTVIVSTEASSAAITLKRSKNANNRRVLLTQFGVYGRRGYWRGDVWL